MLRLHLRSPIAAIVLVSLTAFVAPAVDAETPFDGHWRGAINLPTGSLAIDVDFMSDAAGTISGDITIPAQSAQDVPLAGIEAEGRSLQFQISGIPGDPSFDGELSADGASLQGTFTQGGANLTFSLERGLAPAAAARAALEGFDAIVEKAVADFNVPGLGIAIVHGDEVIYAKGFGYRDREQKLPMTPDTLFAIGSTTKAMTATVLGVQVDEGLLEWDEPLSRYLPRFRLADPMITASITPRDLVTHRSGLPRHDLLWYNNNEGSRADLIARFAHLELTADLRQRFQYNNLMFMTAGYLSGHLDGGRWEDTLRTRLFLPLGMTRSNFSVDASEQDPDHALPYRENDDDELEHIPFRRIDLIGPAGSVNSSVNEMTRWLRFNLAGGKVDGQPLIQTSTLADIHAPHMVTEAPPSPEDRVAQQAYGMGWMVEVYRGHRRIQHGGGIDGFATSVMFLPDDGLGLVAFTNRSSGLGALVNQQAIDRILGLEPVDWLGDALKRSAAGKAGTEEAKTKKDSARSADTQPSHPLTAYAGTYDHPGYGRVIVDLAAETLSFTYNHITTPLEHWHYDVWNGTEGADDPTFENMRFQFRSNLDGQIAELLAPFEITAAPIVFTKQPDPKLSDPTHLARYVGTYVCTSGQRATVALSSKNLTLFFQGQPLYTLEPNVSGRFGIKGLQGVGVGFDEDEAGAASQIIFFQPHGVFECGRVTPSTAEGDRG